MTTEEWLLAAFSTAAENELTPVQVQKMLFLIEKAFGNTGYDFQPYDYGPFDAAVYEDLRKLAAKELVKPVPTGRGWVKHALTPAGLARGKEIAGRLSKSQQDYIAEVSSFVRSLSFSDLVKAIYKAYPEMRTNSVFRD